METELNSANFETEVLKSDMPVLVDFYATWCGPCKMIAPIVEEIAKEYDGAVKVCKLNVDDAVTIATKYNVQYIPTLALFVLGEVVKTSVGGATKDEIVEKLGLKSFKR